MAIRGHVQAPPDGAGKKVDNVVVDTDKYRQIVSVGDPDSSDAIQKVTSGAPAPGDYAAVVALSADDAAALGDVAQEATLASTLIEVADLNSKIPALGQADAANSIPVVLANNSIPNVFAQISLTNSGEGLADNGSTTAAMVAANMVTAALVVDMTSFEGKLTVEASVNTLVWEAIPFIKERVYYNFRDVTAFTATEQWSLLIPDGMNYIRVTCSDYAAGAADISYVESPRPPAQVHTYNIPLSASAPDNASVGSGASAEVVAANASRRGLVLVNTSANRISLGFGSAAELDKGVTLLAGGSYVMGESSLFLGAINAIASAGSSNLSIQEFV